MDWKSQWKNSSRLIFNDEKLLQSCFIYRTCKMAFFFLSRGEVTEREPSVISSFPLHSSSLRMQAAASPSFKLAVLLLTVVLIHFLSFFSDLKKKKKFYMATSWTKLYAFPAECPRDTRDRGWMLIRNPVKFPRSAWSHPEGSEL